MSPVIVLHAPLPGHAVPGAEEALLAALPYSKRLELERAGPGARRASLAGIALALVALRRLYGPGVGAAALQFPLEGKPRLPGGPSFSISHAAGRVGCAAGAGLELGFDMEGVAVAVERSRLQHWTAVEATLKAAGLGVRASSRVVVDAGRRFATLDGASYRLQEVELHADVVAHLASQQEFESVTIEPVSVREALAAATAR